MRRFLPFARARAPRPQAAAAAAAAARPPHRALRAAGRYGNGPGVGMGHAHLSVASAFVNCCGARGIHRAFSSSATEQQRGGEDMLPPPLLDDPGDAALRAAAATGDAPPPETVCVPPGGAPPPAGGVSPLLEGGEAAENVADLAYIADLSWYSPPDLVVRLLDYVHTGAGLEWWATIAATTVGLRVLLFPIMIKAMRSGAILAQIKPEMDVIKSDLDKSTTQEEQQVHQQRLKNLMTRNSINPLAPLMPILAQMPVFMSFFFGIRRMTENMGSMETGGFLLSDLPFVGQLDFLDLTQPDTTYLLPGLCAATFWMSIQLGGETGVQNEQQATMKKFMRFVAVAMVVPMAYMPTGLFCYWLTSNVFTLGQALAMKAPGMKAFFGIPKVTPPPGAGNAASGAWSGFAAPTPPPPPGATHATDAAGVIDVMMGAAAKHQHRPDKKRGRETAHQKRRRRRQR